MLDQVATRLLEGAFICESTAPEAYRWLNSESGQTDVSALLDLLGRRLTSTPNEQAFYAAWKRIGQNERTEVKRTFTGIKQTIRPVIHFIMLCMDAEKKDSSPTVGDRLEYPTLLKTVAGSLHLTELLHEFGTMGKDFTVSDATVKGMLDKVIQQMERWGYLILINKEQSSYRFTGKLDYYYQVVDFLMENEEIEESVDQEDNPEQGRLL